MDDEAHSAPFLVSLAPFSLMPLPSTFRRRLSSSFVEPSRPVSSERPLAWVSLQGRLVNSEEASSARAIGGGLSREQAVAWDLFSPIQRFLIVAVIGVAVAESLKNQQIWHLKKCVEVRDQVLSSMQQKLDNLCDQLNNTKELHSTAATDKLSTKDGELQLNESFGSEKIKFVDCGCWHCDQHCGFFNELVGASVTRASSGNEVLQYKMPFSNEEQEERRMSDLSDWASSVTSAADIQLNTLAVEQDIYNLKRDCEEKDTTIKELTTLLNSAEVANSKRVAELEDIIRRKNTTITKLKKDLMVLEQKVVQLSRLRRPSFPTRDSSNDQQPQMRENLLYDMESTTSPSSSDSDSTPLRKAQHFALDVTVQNLGAASALDQKSTQAKVVRSQSVSPLKAVSSTRKSNTASSSQKQLSARGDLKKSRRPSLNGAKSAAAHKRWVQS